MKDYIRRILNWVYADGPQPKTMDENQNDRIQSIEDRLAELKAEMIMRFPPPPPPKAKRKYTWKTNEDQNKMDTTPGRPKLPL